VRRNSKGGSKGHGEFLLTNLNAGQVGRSEVHSRDGHVGGRGMRLPTRSSLKNIKGSEIDVKREPSIGPKLKGPGRGEEEKKEEMRLMEGKNQ